MKRHRLLLLSWCIVALLSGCAQVIDTSPAISSGTSANRFFWTNDELARGLHYTLSDSAAYSTLVVSSLDGANILENGRSAFRIRSTTDTVKCDSLGKSALFPLSGGFHFGTYDTSVVTPLSVSELLLSGAGKVFALTDSSGLYYRNGTSQWTRVAQSFSPYRGHIALDSLGNILVTSHDSIFASSNEGASWAFIARPAINNSIRSIALLGDSGMYVGVGDGTLMANGPVSPGLSFKRIQTTSSAVVAISAWRDFGADTNGITSRLVSSDGATVYSFHSNLRSSSRPIPNIFSIQHRPRQTLLTSSAGEFYLGSDTLINWQPITGLQVNTPTAVAFDTDYSIYVGTNSGFVANARYGSYGSGYALSGPQVRAILPVGAGEVLVADLSRLRAYNKRGQVLDTSSPNMSMTVTRGKGSGPVFLVSGMLKTGTSWSCGALTNALLQNPIPITARVIDHVDTLVVRDSLSNTNRVEGETIIVQYSYETANATPDPNFPLYWLIYYTLGKGPIRIEEYPSSPKADRMASHSAILQE